MQLTVAAPAPCRVTHPAALAPLGAAPEEPLHCLVTGVAERRRIVRLEALVSTFRDRRAGPRSRQTTRGTGQRCATNCGRAAHVVLHSDAVQRTSSSSAPPRQRWCPFETWCPFGPLPGPRASRGMPTIARPIEAFWHGVWRFSCYSCARELVGFVLFQPWGGVCRGSLDGRCRRRVHGRGEWLPLPLLKRWCLLF